MVTVVLAANCFRPSFTIYHNFHMVTVNEVRFDLESPISHGSSLQPSDYNVTGYFWSQLTMKKNSKMRHVTALGLISRERFRNFTAFPEQSVLLTRQI